MKQIGEFLKQKRLEKGLTIDQIVDITRMPATRIKAIEEGDISLFKDDITYLQFFIKSYCKAVDVDYNEFKNDLNESINGYTTAFEAQHLKEINESEQHIREKSNQRIREYQVRNKPKKVERKVDFSLISFVAVLAVLLTCVLYVGGKWVIDVINKDEPIVDEKPNDEDIIDKPQIDKPVEPEKKEIETIQSGESVDKFDILNAEEKFIIRIEFVPSSWFQLTLDGIVQTTPKAQIYSAKEVLEIEIDPTKTKEVSMRFGYFAKMKVFVDEKEILFDETIAYKEGVQTIVFTLKGE